MSERYYHHAEGVASRLVLDEAVIVHPRQGEVVALNLSGALLWFAADGTRGDGELAALVARAYGLPQAPEVSSFLQELVNAGLLAVSDAPLPAPAADLPPVEIGEAAYEPPACKVREPLEALAATCGSSWTVPGSCNPQAFGACVDPWD